eukprot:944698-Rhodomonas_salina.3
MEKVTSGPWVTTGYLELAKVNIMMTRKQLNAGVSAMILPSKLPLPVLTGDDRHADIKWDLPTRWGVAVIGDKSALHPFMGKGKSMQWGT